MSQRERWVRLPEPLHINEGDIIELTSAADGTTQVRVLSPPNGLRRAIRRFALWTLRLSGAVVYEDRRRWW